MEWIPVALFLAIVTALLWDRIHPLLVVRDEPPVEGILPPKETPVLFHSKFCPARYGSPCSCERCHCPKGPTE